MPALVPDLPDDDVLVATVGPGAFERGRRYVAEGRVSGLRYHPTKRVLSGAVRGTATRPYEAVVRFDTPTGLTGWCTCPVRVGCKHVAAVVLAARTAHAPEPGGAAARPLSGWERALAEVVSSDDDAERGLPLGLQVEVAAPTPSARRASGVGAAPRILLRPVVQGARGGWVRSGISWREVSAIYGYRSARQDPDHRDALRSLYLQSTGRSAYGVADGPLDAATVGSALWRLLAEALAVGVMLVPARTGLGPVVLEGPAHASVDVRKDPATGALTVEPLVRVGERTVPAVDVVLLGAPAHGVAVVGDQDVDGDESTPSLVLAPLDVRAGPALTHLLQEGRLAVPAGDVDRFVQDYYPSLSLLLPVTSSDASVALPELVPPELLLAVSYVSGPEVRLTWAFEYRVGQRTVRVPLGRTAEPPPRGVARDHDAERRLLAETAAAGVTVHEGEERRRGLAVVDVVEDLLPRVRAAGVRVDEVGRPLTFRRTESAPLVRLTATESSDRDWLDLGIDVSIDGEPVPFVTLFTALAAGQDHVLLDTGTYFSLDRPELDALRRLIEEARGLVDRDGEPPRLSRFQVSLWEDLAALGVVEEQSMRWAASLRALADADGEAATHPVPAGLDAELRPYQLDGYRWLTFLWEHRLGGILADDMGLGKTLQTLAAVAWAKETGRLTAPALVVAPTSVVPNWAHEAARFTPGLRVVRVEETGTRRAVGLAEHVAGADVVITSYALFRLEYEEYEALPWGALVLDEAQVVKNHQAKTYQCARRLPAPVKIAMTGTPLENSLMDLWSMLSIVAPGLFPQPQRFTEVYRTPIERDGDAERLATLRRRIAPFLRRRTKEQVAAELPPKLEQVLGVELTPAHREVYERHLQRERQKVLGMLDAVDRNRFAIFRSLTLLRQLSLDPSLVDESYVGIGSAKVDALLENLREVLEGGHRALVFSQFTRFLRLVRDRLDAEGVETVYLDGRTRDRGARIEEFRSGRAPVFLISLKAGGVGLNLTEADYCFLLDPWWNPAVEAQAVDRAHRIGQDKTVMVYRLVSEGTIEEKVMALKARKQDLFTRVMEEDALMSGPLSAADIQELFA